MAVVYLKHEQDSSFLSKLFYFLESIIVLCCFAFRYIIAWSQNKHAYATVRHTIAKRHPSSYARLAKELDDISMRAFHLISLRDIGGPNHGFQIDESLFVKRKVRCSLLHDHEMFRLGHFLK